MKFVLLLLVSLSILPLVVKAFESLHSETAVANLTHWREHRRKKRFILFENAGICKLVTGVTYPVDLGDKKPWRQLVMTLNFQYQFPVPPKPIYPWDRFDNRNLKNSHSLLSSKEMLRKYKDETQEFLYEFAENLMERRGMPGRECLLKAICENAQIHIHQGLYAEILHRLLMPQRNLNFIYTEAWNLGKRGQNCQTIYPKAKKCLLDDYLHVREDFSQQSFVK